MKSQKVILLVEDNKQDELLTIRALQKHGMRQEIIVCRDGAEALDWIFATGKHSGRNPATVPTVILLDLKLPKLNGHEVLAAVRRDPTTKHLPIVVLTTSREESDVCASYESGANSYVQKPVSFDEFSDVVKSLGHYWLNVNEPPVLKRAAGDLR